MRDRGVSISLGEGFFVRPGSDISEFAIDLDIMAELGISRINSVSLDTDWIRSFDQLGELALMASERAMEVTVEFVPGLTIGNLDAALAAVRHVGQQNFRLLIDTMHLVRSGSGAAELASIDPALIGYVQLCDVPLDPRNPNYGEEAMFERMVPGEGELPLCEILAVVPAEVIVGLEVPMRKSAEAGVGPHERLRRCVEGARSVLSG